MLFYSLTSAVCTESNTLIHTCGPFKVAISPVLHMHAFGLWKAPQRNPLNGAENGPRPQHSCPGGTFFFFKLALPLVDWRDIAKITAGLNHSLGIEHNYGCNCGFKKWVSVLKNDITNNLLFFSVCELGFVLPDGHNCQSSAYFFFPSPYTEVVPPNSIEGKA